MSLSEPFQGKTIVIVGGANGIGRACARRAVKRGARVVIGDIDENAGMDLVRELTDADGQAIFVPCDVGERLDVHNLIAATLDSFDGIDALINNANLATPAGFLDLDEKVFDAGLRVNLKGAFLVGQAVARQMVKQLERRQDDGEDRSSNYAIVHISSVNAVVTAPELVPLAAAKGGLNQLTKAMAVALAPYAIRVNAVGPGNVRTNGEDEAMATTRSAVLARTPIGRLAEPDEIAAIATFLVSDEASYITGHCLYADGGRLALNYLMPGT